MSIFDYDYTAHNREELDRLRSIIDKAIEAINEREREMVLNEFKAVASKAEYLGVTAADMMKELGSKKSGRAKSKVKPKYRNPNNEAEQWSGRGRKPAWVVSQLAAGASMESLEI